MRPVPISNERRMRNRAKLGNGTLALVALLLNANIAVADPVTVRGFLDGAPHGAIVEEQLTLSFPDFNVILPDVTHVIPGFCDECNTGAPIPFTQRTGSFSGHSVANAGLHTIDADVSGSLSFTGPTDTLNISHDAFATDSHRESVQWSGWLVVREPNRVLFNGTLRGSGVGSASYENTGTGDTRLGGYQFDFAGVAATPEPATILLFGTGAAWLAMRRRKSTSAS